MATRPRSNLTVEQYLEAYQGASGRYELVDGEVLKMAAETVLHVRLKGRIFGALATAIDRKGLDCEAFQDGVSIKISPNTAREPDVSVQCGSQANELSMVLDRPLIVVEVVSPSSNSSGANQKLAEYFSVPSIMHYLIVWPKQSYCYHHKRIDDNKVLTTIVRSGTIEFDPPGIQLSVSDFLGKK
ncbi:MAG: Uma2 family endonuclease [Rhizobiales bacterium]|nr:Uma2 family endonuclease [Hyphomicrobiales bacterium]MBI3672566.1 Uma2 family endonuclease [Hyphomicrobiales bacterium]